MHICDQFYFVIISSTALYSLLIHMFIYCKYKVLLALQYQSQYPVFTLSSHCIRNNQQMQLYAVNFIPLLSSLYMFRATHTPILRGTHVHPQEYNCIYSHWYNHRLA